MDTKGRRLDLRRKYSKRIKQKTIKYNTYRTGDKMKNKKMITTTLTTSALLLATYTSNAEEKKPNVIFILADDLGYNGLHCYGNEWLETPNIDKLYSEGMHFTNGTAAYPTCQPSRMALLSGQYGPRTGGYRVSEKHKGFENLIKYIVPEKTNLALDKITIAEAFKSAGYTTAMWGKWHVGNDSTSHPTKQGFDEAISATGHYKLHHSTPSVTLPKGVCAEEYFTDLAIKFMDKAHKSKKPFFVFMPYYFVHKPLEAKQEYIDHFKKKLKGIDFKSKSKNSDETPVIAAMTKQLDACIGKLLNSVKEMGVQDNTIILFTSDNGSYNYDFTGKTRGRKGDTYEGGMKVPYIFSWPGKIKPGSESEEHITGVDVYPTLLSLAGVKRPENYILDGENIAPILLGKKRALPERNIYCFYPKYAQFNKKKKHWTFSWRNVMYEKNLKLIEYPEYDEYELFDLQNDPVEAKNLSDKNPELRKTLTEKLHKWLKDINAPKLTPNPNYSLK